MAREWGLLKLISLNYFEKIYQIYIAYRIFIMWSFSTMNSLGSRSVACNNAWTGIYLALKMPISPSCIIFLVKPFHDVDIYVSIQLLTYLTSYITSCLLKHVAWYFLLEWVFKGCRNKLITQEQTARAIAGRSGRRRRRHKLLNWKFSIFVLSLRQ